ncbi:aldo/keto reductase [Allorhizocola rhizosphaerae]|uniref:aldo/keto reductase n=1 Tax=Allorhizocola rhizosphaerae TaxID=1872709 RepID=UPI000E3BA769|nr:aldo/keto reductase [Allorhizocola rhizosphaerae]
MSLDIPIIGFGTWQATGRRGYEAILKALSVGYRHIDTATMYGNESEVGRALRDSGVPRDEVFITTKLPPSRAGHERETLEASLRALGVDSVDLWLIHWPPRDSVATWRAFIELRDLGLARAIGVSNYSTRQLDQLIDATGETPALNQIEWGPSLYDDKRQAEHRERGIVLEGYSPFKTTNLRNATLVEIAKAHEATPAQVVLRWHIQHDVVVIPKSVTPERIAANLDVFGFTLSDEEMTALNGL